MSPGKFAQCEGAEDTWNCALDDGWRYILTPQRRLGTGLDENNYFSTSSTFLAVCCKHVTYKPLQSHDGLVQHVLRRRKCLNSRFMEAVNKPRWILDLDRVLRNSASEEFAYIWQIRWKRIIAMKIEKTRLQFLGDIFAVVAVLAS